MKKLILPSISIAILILGYYNNVSHYATMTVAIVFINMVYFRLQSNNVDKRNLSD